MVKTIGHILVSAIFLLLFVGFFHPITAISQDLGRHIKTGEIILSTVNVPKTNLYSYTYPHFPFINHHWFSEVLFYVLENTIGFFGILLVTTFTIIAAFGLLFFFVYKKTKAIIPIALCAFLYIHILFERTDVRPEIFSFLFLSLFIFILYSYRQKYTKYIFLLIPLELIWVNTHIYFPIGIAVLGLFFIDALITHRKNIRSQSIFTLGLVLMLAGLAILINPNGIAGATYPLKVFQNYGYQIEENQTLFFLEKLFPKPSIPYFKFSILLLFVSLFLCFKKTRPIDWFLAIFFTFLGFQAIRNFPLFVFGTFVVCATYLSLIWQVLEKPFKKYSVFITLIFTIGICCFVAVSIQNSISQRDFGYSMDTSPKNAVDFMQKNNIKGPIFNNFDIGSYLEYRLFPKEKVFVDGRPEAYPATFFSETYVPAQIYQHTFEALAKKYNFNTIFFSHLDQTPWGISFLKFIVQDDNWRIVYLNESIIILVKNTQDNAKVIQKASITQESLLKQKTIETNVKALAKISSFYNKVGWTNLEAKTYQEILEKDPNYCFALYNVAVLYSQANNPTSAIYTGRYQAVCK